jgi:hypothetical protein
MKRVSSVLSGACFVWALVLAAPAMAAQSEPVHSPAHVQQAVLYSTSSRATVTQVAERAEPRGMMSEGHGDRDFDRGRGFEGGFGFGGFYNPFWSGLGWAPYGYWNYWAPFYGYPYGPGYYARHFDGGLKLKIKGPDPNDAEVFANGAYVGTVNDFNGIFQQLNLRPGPYTIQVRAKGYRPLSLKVRIQPDKTITYHGQMQKVA